MEHDPHTPTGYRITVAGTMSERFARGLAADVAVRRRPGFTTLEVQMRGPGCPCGILEALANLGVAVVAVESWPQGDRPDDEYGGDRT